MSVVDLDEMKDYLTIRGSADDAKLQDVIDGAEGAIAERIGPLEPEEFTATLYPSGEMGGQIVLPYMHIASLTSVTPLDSAFLVLDTMQQNSGVLTMVDRSYFGSSRYTVVGEAGFDPVPPDLRLAIKEHVRDMWDAQRGSGSRPGPNAPESTPDPTQFSLKVERTVRRYESVSVA